MPNRVDINPDILWWAVERAGIDPKEYFAAQPKHLAWAEGAEKPTIGQLEKLSNALHIPFGYFFLDKRPNEQIGFPFFRTLGNSTQQVKLNVFDTINTLERRQEWLRSYLVESGDEELNFVGKFDLNSNVNDVIDNIREVIGLPNDWANGLPTMDSALNVLVDKIESARITVSINGVVGNHTRRKINVEDCRGFVIVDEYAPFMFINNNDTKGAQIFTAIHELAHIWLGESAAFDNENFMPSEDPLEKKCDSIAAELLVPSSLLMEAWEEEVSFDVLYRKFKVSPIVIARRALDLDLISKPIFMDFYNEYMQKIRNGVIGGGGGNFHYTAKKRIGKLFAYFVDSAVKQNKLLYRDAYALTGLNGTTYHTFVNDYLY